MSKEEEVGRSPDGAGLSPTVEPASSLDGFATSIPNAFTPGPWHVEPVCGEDDQQYWSDDWNGKVWCVCHPLTECDASTVVPWVNEGDAHLIAAAPMLLEGAQDALETLKLLRLGLRESAPETMDIIGAHINELEYAIAKARGQ